VSAVVELPKNTFQIKKFSYGTFIDNKGLVRMTNYIESMDIQKYEDIIFITAVCCITFFL